ncbi:MAG: c-type cytochrome biogenesis protein CcmI [Deltaproteobacteria bacterium]|nr:MAG: c-type cytochrome biogenesis protein CcmI [Deltaproteobacteria bacterium]
MTDTISSRSTEALSEDEILEVQARAEKTMAEKAAAEAAKAAEEAKAKNRLLLITGAVFVIVIAVAVYVMMGK